MGQDRMMRELLDAMPDDVRDDLAEEAEAELAALRAKVTNQSRQLHDLQRNYELAGERLRKMEAVMARVRAVLAREKAAAEHTCSLLPRDRTEHAEGYAEAQLDLADELAAILTPKPPSHTAA